MVLVWYITDPRANSIELWYSSTAGEFVKIHEQGYADTQEANGMYTHAGLENGHSYDYILRYNVDDYGWSDFSKPVTGMAGGMIEGACWRESAPCVRVMPDLTTIDVEWFVIPEEGRSYREYKVLWKRADDDSASWQTVSIYPCYLGWDPPPPSVRYTITGLEQNTRYLVQVRAFSCNGEDEEASDACAAPGQEGPGIWHGAHTPILVTTKADLSELP